MVACKLQERRYLLKLFPELAKPNVCVLEVGAGHGSAALAILKQNPTARVFAIDTSLKAVSILQNVSSKVVRAWFPCFFFFFFFFRLG